MTVMIPEKLYQVLREIDPDEEIPEIVLEGIRHAIRRERCRKVLIEHNGDQKKGLGSIIMFAATTKTAEAKIKSLMKK